ncbi:MAG: Wzz/FepE/Etk N-terminal domain-containing protein, partial [Planctomycetota bacterium]
MNQEMQLLADERSNSTSHVVHSVMRFLWLLRRRKTIVLAILAASIVLGIIYFGAAPRVYQAKAQILVKQSQDPMAAQAASNSNTQNEMAT